MFPFIFFENFSGFYKKSVDILSGVCYNIVTVKEVRKRRVGRQVPERR